MEEDTIEYQRKIIRDYRERAIEAKRVFYVKYPTKCYDMDVADSNPTYQYRSLRDIIRKHNEFRLAVISSSVSLTSQSKDNFNISAIDNLSAPTITPTDVS